MNNYEDIDYNNDSEHWKIKLDYENIHGLLVLMNYWIKDMRKIDDYRVILLLMPNKKYMIRKEIWKWWENKLWTCWIWNIWHIQEKL